MGSVGLVGMKRGRQGGGGGGGGGGGEYGVRGIVNTMEEIYNMGMKRVSKEKLEKMARDVRAVLKDVQLAEAKDIDAMRASTERVNTMMLRAAMKKKTKHIHEKVCIAEVWQAVAEVRKRFCFGCIPETMPCVML